MAARLVELAQVSHYSVFQAQAGVAQYNHGAVAFPFRGKLYVQWQSSKIDEDGPHTRVLYASSEDGINWAEARELARSDGQYLITNGGWWSDGQILVAFLNMWPKHLDPKAGQTAFRQSPDGTTWSSREWVITAQGNPVPGVIEQDLKALPSHRILTAFHRQPGLIATPYFTDDPRATTGWTAGRMQNLVAEPGMSRELEPSWFRRDDGSLVMIFRDQASSFRVLASQSQDNGVNWTTPTLTALPDARTKLSAGNLPDGTAFIVNNPSGNKTRLPLAITLSEDGKHFNRAYILRGRSTLPAMRFAGKYKRPGYSYPKSVVWRDSLWVAYAVNKEDIAISEIPLSALSAQ